MCNVHEETNEKTIRGLEKMEVNVLELKIDLFENCQVPTTKIISLFHAPGLVCLANI